MTSERLPDGRWHHTFRQSDLKTADLCLERARREWAGLTTRRETDAASVGTAVHAAIECCLTEHHDGCALDVGTTLEVFNQAFTAQTQLPNFEWVKYDEGHARAFGDLCVVNWYQQVLPTLGDEAELELTFLVDFYEDDKRAIALSGRIDYVGESAKDWKTSGRMYQAWEKTRWDVQSTVYTSALHTLFETPEPLPFEFVVMHPKGVQRITVQRGWDHWAWLTQKCVNLAELVEAELPRWPLSDDHALCSPVWCESWADCKGKSLGPDPWNQIKGTPVALAA